MSEGRKGVLKASEIPAPILRSRAELLAGKGSPLSVCHSLSYPDTVSIDSELVKRVLASDGIAYLRVKDAFTPTDFLEVATRFGDPLPELDPVARRNCILPEILQIAVTTPNKPSIYEQPFSLEPISLHTEMSRALEHAQPRFLLFACRATPASNVSSGTLVVSQKEVISRLSKTAKSVLMQTRLASHEGAPNVILKWSDEEGNVAQRLSFRDPLPAMLEYWIGDGFHENVSAALVELLDVLYVRVPVRTVSWSTGTIAVLDNYRLLHGRTQLLSPKRVLWRIRICGRIACST